MKLSDTDEVSPFEIASMMRGKLTKDMHTFYGSVKSSSGDSEFNLVNSIAGSIPKILNGSRIPMNKQTNNPSLSGPSVTAMRFFGALPIFKKAMDQIHAKKIGVFTTPVSGSGLNAFEFKTTSSFQGDATLQSIVNRVLFGSFANTITSGHYLEQQLATLATSVGSTIGASDPLTKLNAGADTAKLMQGLAHGFSGGASFDSSMFSDGVTMAKEVTEYLSKTYGNSALEDQYGVDVSQTIWT